MTDKTQRIDDAMSVAEICDQLTAENEQLKARLAGIAQPAGSVVVPIELLMLWHRVMLQNPGDYEDKCANEMSALLTAAKEPR